MTTDQTMFEFIENQPVIFKAWNGSEMAFIEGKFCKYAEGGIEVSVLFVNKELGSFTTVYVTVLFADLVSPRCSSSGVFLAPAEFQPAYFNKDIKSFV